MLCLRDNTSNILHEHKANLELGDEKTQILKTALKLICNDICMTDLDPNSYPTAHSMTDIHSQLALVPESLQTFLRPTVKTDERVAVWGQNLIEACRPRSGVLPYHMGLCIQLDHRFGSKWMINKLHKLGYYCGYRVKPQHLASPRWHDWSVSTDGSRLLVTLSDREGVRLLLAA